jgi:hypothetical protein
MSLEDITTKLGRNQQALKKYEEEREALRAQFLQEAAREAPEGSWAYINKSDRQVYSRIWAEGAPSLDSERLSQENPALWERITLPVLERELLSFDELDPEDLAEVTKYISKGKLTPKLLIRKASEEELNRN